MAMLNGFGVPKADGGPSVSVSTSYHARWSVHPIGRGFDTHDL